MFVRRIGLSLVLALEFAVQALALVPVIPGPKQVTEGEVCGRLSYRKLVLSSEFSPDATGAVMEELCACAGRGWPWRVLKVDIRQTKGTPQSDDWYHISRKSASRIEVEAGSPQAAQYALETLLQLVVAGYDRCFDIIDWPDIGRRVFMDDISRGEVPTVEQVKRQIRYLARLKYNGYLFYNENVTRVPSHPDYVPENGFFTMEDLDEIAEYASRWHVEFIGGQQSFGHLEKILSLPQYRHLGLTENMLDADSPQARAFIKDVLCDLCMHIPSKYFCVFCDETFDLEKVADKERYYSDYINYLVQVLRSQGKRTIVCGDMLMKYPAMIPMLDRDIIVMTWNYDAAESFEPWIAPFRDACFEWWVAPGVHSSGRMVPDMRAAEGNRRFITEGRSSGCDGVMVCSWDETVYHPFEHLKYGIAQFAETMWTVSRNSVDEDFRARYESVSGCNITALCDTMMELSDIPMFAGMNDRVFYQRFTPSVQAPLVIDRRSLGRARDLLKDASGYAQSGVPFEEYAWLYAADCYRFMVESRLGMADIDGLVREGNNGVALNICDKLDSMVQNLLHRFLIIWDRENQPHSRDAGIELFNAKKAELMAVRQAIERRDTSALRVIDRINPYMCFWLTTLLLPGEVLPSEALDPTPGKRFAVGTREAKWTKTESLEGLSMDVNKIYLEPAMGSVMCSYAQVTAPAEMEVELLLGYVGECSIYCNGQQVLQGAISGSFAPDSQRLRLHLKPGVNHLYITLSKQFPECSFCAVLDGPVVVSRKHKYLLELQQESRTHVYF